MTRGGRGARLAAVAAVAALIAGCITGTLLTIEDEAWPARGGMKAVVQISALFSAYALPVTLAVGALLAITLSPLMARRGPFAHLLAGLPIGLGIHFLVDVAIGERIDSPEDWLGGTAAGAAAGPLWWLLVQRRSASRADFPLPLSPEEGGPRDAGG
ncbi:MAG TPA: hypothetical protein VF645_11750 [Allosphingosinicella sp.]